MRFKLLTVTLIIALFSVVQLSAQVSRGSISGTITDASGAVLPDTEVNAIQEGTTVPYATAKTTGSGSFRILALPSGSYTLEIAKSGFNRAVRKNIIVSAGADAGLGTVALRIAQATEEVDVRADATPLVETTQSQITNTFSSKSLNTFVGVQENQGLDNLALFVPGVTSSRDLGFSNTNGGVGFSANGIRGRNNDQQIDGQNNNDNSVGGPSLFLSNTDFVEQYQIVTSNFTPEFGRNSGSVVNIITKSGTNAFHGTVFGTEGNAWLNTRTNVQKRFQSLSDVPNFNNIFTGATIGGPIVKNRVFFFGGFDRQIQNASSTYSTGNTTPTPAGLAALAGCFPGNTNVAVLQKFGPYGVTGGNPTPSGALSTTSVTGCATPIEIAGVQRSLSTDIRGTDYLIKSDITLTNSDHLSARYIYNKGVNFNTDAFGTGAAGYPANVPALSQAINLSEAHNFGSRLVNELRVNYGRVVVQFGGNGIGNTIPEQGQIGTALARISFNSPSQLGFGPATNAPQGRIVNTWQGQDNVSYSIGRHQLKTGVNFTYQRSPNIFLPNLNGAYRFSSLSSFVANTPNRVRVASGDFSTEFREYDTFAYFGDDFKVTNNLTLNLGVTYSYFGQPLSILTSKTVTRESNPATAFFNPTLPLSIRTFPNIPASKNNWGPNIGFAYSPQWGGFLTGNGKTVLRGGFRISFDPAVYNIYSNSATAAPLVLLQTLTGAKASVNPLPANPTGTNVRTALASSLVTGVVDPRTFAESTVSPDFGPDRVYGYSFGVQRELGAKSVLEVRYVGNHGTNLFQSVNANPFIGQLATDFPNLVHAGLTPCPAAQAVVPSAVGRVNCNQGIVRSRTNDSISDYNGLQTEFRSNNLFNQLTLRTSYTFSKTTDNASEIFGSFGAGGTTAFSQNPLDFGGRGAEHGTSGLDIPQSWTVSFSESLPFFRTQHGIVGHVLGGWEVSGNYILSSGQGYTPVQQALNGTDYYDLNFLANFNGSIENARPFLGNPSAPNTSVGIFAGDAGVAGPANVLIDFGAFNASGAVNPVAQSAVHYIVNGATADGIFKTPFGNVGRNSVRDAIQNIANFSVSKSIKISDRVSFDWRASMLNVFNHSNPGSIDPFIDDAGLTSEGTGFGDPSVFTDGNVVATGQGRRSILFGLKLKF